MQKILIRSLLISLLMLCANITQASVIFDNGMPYQGAYLAVDQEQNLADDFSFSDDSYLITDVHWLGVYGARDPVPDNFTIRIYSDGGGMPTPMGSHIYEQVIGNNVVRTDTGLQLELSENIDVYEYSALINPFLAEQSVTYWLEITNNIGSIWLWTSGDGDDHPAVSSNGGGWRSLQAPRVLSFQLTNSVVPEPATILLFGFGLLGLAGIGRRKK